MVKLAHYVYISRRRSLCFKPIKPVCQFVDDLETMDNWVKSDYYTYTMVSKAHPCADVKSGSKCALPEELQGSKAWHSAVVTKNCQNDVGELKIYLMAHGFWFDTSELEWKCLTRWDLDYYGLCVYFHIIFWHNPNMFAYWEIYIDHETFYDNGIVVRDSDKNSLWSSSTYGDSFDFTFPYWIHVGLRLEDMGTYYKVTRYVDDPVNVSWSEEIDKRDIPYDTKGAWGFGVYYQDFQTDDHMHFGAYDLAEVYL